MTSKENKVQKKMLKDENLDLSSGGERNVVSDDVDSEALMWFYKNIDKISARFDLKYHNDGCCHFTAFMNKFLYNDFSVKKAKEYLKKKFGIDCDDIM